MLVIVCVNNLYKNVTKKFKGRKLNYQSYLDVLKDKEKEGKEEKVIAHAYVSDLTGSAKFLTCLRRYGYKLHYDETLKKYRWNVGACVEVCKNIDNLNIVVIGSSSIEFIPLIEWLKRNGVKVIIFACNISHRLRSIADECIEITEDMLIETHSNETI